MIALDVTSVNPLSFSNPQKSTSETPLHAAARAGRAACIKELVEKGAHVDAAMTDGSTALHLACAAGSEESAARLMELGASIAVRNAAGWTPLREAVAADKPALVQTFLRKGASAFETGRDGTTVVEAALSKAVHDMLLSADVPRDVLRRRATVSLLGQRLLDQFTEQGPQLDVALIVEGAPPLPLR